FVEIDGYFFYRSTDKKQIRLDHAGKDGRTEVFVDHRFHTDQVAFLCLHDRDTSAANSHNNKTIIDQAADGSGFNNGLGNGGGYNPAPTASGIFHYDPTVFIPFFHRQLLVHKGTDRFGRVLESGVIGI